MVTYRLVPEEDWKEMVRLAVRLNALVEKNADASVLSMAVPARAEGPRPEPPATPQPPEALLAESGNGTVKKYRIGKGAWKYADVIAREMAEREFTLDEAMATLDPIMETSSSRPRDGVRVALDRDARFRRVEREDGVWYQRVDPSQLNIEEGDLR